MCALLGLMFWVESLVQSAPNPSLLLALLSSETVCTLVATDECNLKSRLLVNALAIAGIRCAVHLLRQPAFWRPRLNMVEALLELVSIVRWASSLGFDCFTDHC